MSKTALKFQENAIVKPETELTYEVRKLGGEGKFSIKAITKKYGAPKKVEKFATKEDNKVVNYQELHYPRISFLVPEGSDQASAISAPKRLWAGKGILENAKMVLKSN
jgi:hypothetical protein